MGCDIGIRNRWNVISGLETDGCNIGIRNRWNVISGLETDGM